MAHVVNTNEGLKKFLSTFKALINQKSEEHYKTDRYGDALFTSGYCPEFAVALSRFLRLKSVKAEVYIMSRESKYTIDDYHETNRMSHVIVEANNENWDIHGDEADKNWENDWHEKPGVETEFVYIPSDASTITQLMSEVGNRCFSPEIEELIFQTLRTHSSAGRNKTYVNVYMFNIHKLLQLNKALKAS